jgi:hypothetical protein
MLILREVAAKKACGSLRGEAREWQNQGDEKRAI